MNLDKIGYNPGSLLTMQEVITFAKLANDKPNVDSLWIPESWGREAFASLGALSQITTKPKLGTSIISIYARTPATIAMGATTLDMLSNNRTIIGLGTSTPTLVENWHGLNFEKPLLRMREYVECLKRMITGERVNYIGTYVRVKDFKLLYRPQRERIPIFIAAVNRHMISLACDVADGVLLYLRPIDELKKTTCYIKSITKNKTFEIACVVISAVSNKEPQKARDRAAKTLAFYIAVGEYYNRFISDNGFRNEVEQIVSEYRHNGLDSASRFVSEQMLDSLTICGNREECLKSLNRFKSAGISLPIIQVNPTGNTQSSIKEMLTAF
ncbi:MAG TPA: LLM class flavin-dependent oxidoreductase [Nitrososphaeraceae archaeon]|nr:LLM class flavin-dependent oxidoreductase [Nitrososphaeraceae archaeon]